MKHQIDYAKAEHIIENAQKIFPGNPFAKNRLTETINLRRAIIGKLYKDGESATAIGRYLKLSHSAIIFSIAQHDNFLKFDKGYREKYNQFLRLLDLPKTKHQLKERKQYLKIEEIQNDIVHFSETLKLFTEILKEHIIKLENGTENSL